MVLIKFKNASKFSFVIRFSEFINNSIIGMKIFKSPKNFSSSKEFLNICTPFKSEFLFFLFSKTASNPFIESFKIICLLLLSNSNLFGVYIAVIFS